MSEKRRDSKGRILRNGECQRKDGMYQFDYVGLDGKPKCVYSWKLEPTDPLPKGKRKCLSLREKEKQIQRDMDDGIIPCGGGYTVLSLVERYLSQKSGLKSTTREAYKTSLNALKQEEFAHRRIDKIKLSDAKEWFIKLSKDGKGYSTIFNIRNIVKPAFQMAVDDDLIRKNPFCFTVSKVIDDNSKKRDAITEDEMNSFLNFVKNDSVYCKYYDALYVLFHTGMRIGEFCGLTVKDIDLKNRTIDINHQLQRTRNMEYLIVPPKTETGIRIIPMQNEVYNCFVRIMKDRKQLKVEPSIKGWNGRLYTGFLFTGKYDVVMISMHWERIFQRILKKYNAAKQQNLIITPHVCRHTHASILSEKGVNVKHIQYLLGHSDIRMTTGTYMHTDLENVMLSVKRIDERPINKRLVSE